MGDQGRGGSGREGGTGILPVGGGFLGGWRNGDLTVPGLPEEAELPPERVKTAPLANLQSRLKRLAQRLRKSAPIFLFGMTGYSRLSRLRCAFQSRVAAPLSQSPSRTTLE